MDASKSGRGDREHVRNIRHIPGVRVLAGVGRVSRARLLAGASLIALVAFAAPREALAACSGADRTISTKVPGPVDSDGGAITVTGSGVVTGSSGTLGSDGVDVLTCPATTALNKGAISGGASTITQSQSAQHATGGVGVANSLKIGTLTNSGSIRGGDATEDVNYKHSAVDVQAGAGLSNSGPHSTIGTLTNSGTISGGAATHTAFGGLGREGSATASAGVFNSGAITMLNNSGAITGGQASTYFGKAFGGAGLSNASKSSTITTLINSGAITGGAATFRADGYFQAGDGLVNRGTIGTLTNEKGATISGGGGTSGGYGLSNSGAIGMLTNDGVIKAADNSGTITMLANAGLIDYELYNSGKITTLNNSGTIQFAFSNAGMINKLTNTGAIRGGSGATGSSGVAGGDGVSNSGTIKVLTNTGTISGGTANACCGRAVGGAGISNSETIGTLINGKGGMINGGGATGGTEFANAGGGVDSSGTITTLINSGAIGGGNASTFFLPTTGGAGVLNSGTITTFTNNTGGAISGGNAAIKDALVFGPVSARGGAGLSNFGHESMIGTLINTGAISGGAAMSSSPADALGGAGVSNFGTIGSLTNGGKISGGNATANGSGDATGGAGVASFGTIGTLTNSGKIEGGAATSKSGKATQGDAIFSKGQDASIGTIANSGSIIGNVEIDNQSKVTVTGGSGSTFGSWTGGTITIGNGDLVFGGGNTFLGDDVKVDGGAGTAKNTDPLQVAAPQTIAGSFDQSASGMLDLEFAGVHPNDYGSLTVSGGAALDGELNADLIDGFAFKKGETFDILNFASGSGDFDSFSIDGHACSSTVSDIWTCGSGPVVEELFDKRSLDLYILSGVHGVPEPSSWAMMAIGFLGLGGLGLRRRAHFAGRRRNITAAHPGA
jgi:hypothetical protein